MQSPAINTNYYDQIVTGNVVMDDGFIYGADAERGTVLASAGVSAVAAEKSITFTGATPVATKKVAVTIGGVKFEYTIAESDTVSDIAAGLKALINNATTGSTLMEADNSSGKLTLEAKTAGYAGNSISIVAAPAEDSGVTAGDVTVEAVGQDKGQEFWSIVDSDSATSALQNPKAVLLEDAKQASAQILWVPSLAQVVCYGRQVVALPGIGIDIDHLPLTGHNAQAPMPLIEQRRLGRLGQASRAEHQGKQTKQQFLHRHRLLKM